MEFNNVIFFYIKIISINLKIWDKDDLNLKPKFLRTFSEKNLQANLRNMSTVKPAQMMVEVATVLANSGTDSVSTARILELFGQCLSVTATATEQSKCAPTPQDLKILNITNNINQA